MIGETISHYRIIERLGSGGMGVVYRAEDTRLKRTVALKFLPPDLTRDPEAKQRFIHEAQAASSLQHHNICTVHDIDQTEDGQLYIVMDLYEGETLKDRIKGRALKVEAAADIAIQIAQGLAEAHAHGVLHRDVKPANILITDSGVVKVVDFGLAKLSGATQLTKSRSTLGTISYMSPEQLQGSDVDARADIFSMGVVLYEMLTGKLPFRGDHEAALMYSICNEEPEPLQVHVPDAPSELVHIVSRALEKSPDDRYKTMDDILIDLRRLRKETSKVSMAAYPGGVRRRLSRKTAILTASSVVLIAGAIVVARMLSPRPLPRLNPDAKTRTIALPISNAGYPRLSADGNWMAVAGSNASGKYELHFVSISTGETRRILEDSVWTGNPDISRDGAWLACGRSTRTSTDVVLVSSQSGTIQHLCEGFFTRWSEADERIVYAKGPWNGIPTASGRWELWSIRRNGTDNRLIFTDPGISGPMISYSPSPSRTKVAWLLTSPDFTNDIIVRDLESGEDTRVTYDHAAMDEVFWTKKNDYLIYSSDRSGNFDLWMCPAEGGESLQLTRSSSAEIVGQLSEDGTRLLYREIRSTANIRSLDLKSGEISAITADELNRSGLSLSPDNKRFAYHNEQAYVGALTTHGIRIVDHSRGGTIMDLVPDMRTGGPTAWSPDGQWIAFVRRADSVHDTPKICILSPSSPSSLRVIGEGPPDSSGTAWWYSLRWIDEKTLSWYSPNQRTTWMSAIDDPRPERCYEDSTQAFPSRDRRAMLFRDYRRGREGWWVDSSPSRAQDKTGRIKKILPPVGLTVSPDGRFGLYRSPSGGLEKVILPEGTIHPLGLQFPTGAGGFQISQDNRYVAYLEFAQTSRIVLVENPFIWD